MANKNVNINFRVDSDLRDAWNSAIEKKGCNTGALLREYMKKVVEANVSEENLASLTTPTSDSQPASGRFSFHVSLPNDMVAHLRTVATSEGKSYSALACEAIGRFLEEHRQKQELEAL